MSLSGVRAPDPTQRRATTAGATVTFAHEPGSDRFASVPRVIVEAREVRDPDPRPLPIDLAGATAESLANRIQRLWDRSADYLSARDVDPADGRTGVAGIRARRFFDAVEAALPTQAPALASLPATRRLLRHMERDLYLGRRVELDVASHSTYHPYTDPFIDGLRALERLVPPGAGVDAEAAVVGAASAYVTDQKTIGRSTASVDERDFEASVHMRVINRRYGGQAVSLSPYTDDPMDPWYAVMNVESDPPERLAEHAGRAVFRDHVTGEIFFDGTSEPVPAELVGYLDVQPTARGPAIAVRRDGLPAGYEHLAGAEVSIDTQRRLVLAASGEPLPRAIAGYIEETVCNTGIGLRLLEDGEKPRASFPYDWNRNGRVNIGAIDVSFAGHCHLKAQLEVFGLEAQSRVTLHDARTGQTEELDAEEINDLLFALFDTDAYTDRTGTRPMVVERGRMVGNRTMVRGATGQPQDRLILELADGESAPFALDIISIDGETEVDRAFQPTVEGEAGAFVDNPDFEGRVQRGWSFIDGGRPLRLRVQCIDVTPNGALEHRSVDTVLDPADPADEPILLGSERRGTRRVQHYYYNQRKQTLESQLYAVERTAEGAWQLVPTSQRTPIQPVANLTVSRELVRESALDLHTALLGMMREGLPAIVEKSAGYAVWNYAISSIELTRTDVREEEDGTRFVTYEACVTAGGSDKSWRYIVKEDAEGNEVSAHPITEPPDYFAFRDLWAAVPLYADPGDLQVAYNDAARKRGYLPDRPLTEESMAFFAYASDVVYASLADPSRPERFVIRDPDGDLYFYETRAAFEAEVAGLGEEP